jgi:hypothetical protein
MIRSSLAAAALAMSATALAQGSAPSAAPAAAPAPDAAPAPVLVPRDTPVRLMVLNEVSTRSAQAGDKFVLRVDEAVSVGGVTVVPVGAKAWGEVTQAEESGALGRSGKLDAKLLYLEAGGTRVPIGGERSSSGQAGGRQVTMGAVGFALAAPLAAPLALLAPGNNARLKAGEIYTAFIDGDMLFDPVTKTLSPAPAAPAAPPAPAAETPAPAQQ